MVILTIGAGIMLTALAVGIVGGVMVAIEEARYYRSTFTK